MASLGSVVPIFPSLQFCEHRKQVFEELKKCSYKFDKAMHLPRFCRSNTSDGIFGIQDSGYTDGKPPFSVEE